MEKPNWSKFQRSHLHNVQLWCTEQQKPSDIVPIFSERSRGGPIKWFFLIKLLVKYVSLDQTIIFEAIFLCYSDTVNGEANSGLNLNYKQTSKWIYDLLFRQNQKTVHELNVSDCFSSFRQLLFPFFHIQTSQKKHSCKGSSTITLEIGWNISERKNVEEARLGEGGKR